MPTDPDAIKRFLIHTPPRGEPVKGEPVGALLARIKEATGANYNPKTIPRPFQLEGITFAAEKKASLLFMKMRLGKTLTSLHWAELLRRGGKWKGKGLVIVGKPILLYVWKEQVELHSNLSLECVYSGIENLEAACRSNADLVAVSVYGLQAMFCKKQLDSKKQKNRLRVDSKLLAPYINRFDLAILDETHLWANHTTLRFQIADSLTNNVSYFLGLTGTPHGRDPFDLWSQFYLCDRGLTLGRNYFFFMRAFGKEVKNPFTPSGTTIVFDDKKLPALERKISGSSISYGWEGNIDLPEVVKNAINVGMSEDQNARYWEAIKHFIEVKNDHIERIDAVFIRLRQISSGYLPFTDTNGEKHVLSLKNPTKLQWIEQLIEEIGDNNVKVVLFHDFIRTGLFLDATLTKNKIKFASIRGGIDHNQRTKALDAFRKGDTNWLVCNNSAAIGIDLAMAEYLCFVESPVSPKVRQQVEARAMGAGAGKTIMIDDLVSSPVERRILDFIDQGKELLANTVFAEDLRKSFNEASVK